MKCLSQRTFGFIFVVALSCVASIRAQQLATVSVVVNDASGGVVNTAKVTLANTGTGAVRSETVDQSGTAVLTALPAAAYRLTVDASGYAKYTNIITLTVGQDAALSIRLNIGTVDQTVAVNDSVGNSIDVEKTDTSQVIHTAQIADLPSGGRDFLDFALLTPTATIGRSTVSQAQSPFLETVLQLSFGGLRETHSVFFGLDGTDYSVSLSGVQRASPSLDWVQEFRVIDGPYSADNGRHLGALVNTITKSGTNDLHGSVYEFLRNNAVDAISPLSASGLTTLRFNQFGAYAGGPIRRNKSFAFVGYEGQRRAQSPTYSTFILGCINTRGCLGPGTPSINQVKTSLGLQSEQLNSFLQTDDYDKTIGKLTQLHHQTGVLTLGYLFSNDRKRNAPTAAPGQGLPSTYRDNPVLDQTIYGNYLTQLNRRFTTETVIDFGQRTFHLTPKGAGFEPTILDLDTFQSGGILGSVSYYKETHWEGQENLSFTRRRNEIKFGGGFEPVWINTNVTLFTPGGGVFTNASFFGTGVFANPALGPGTAVELLFLEPRSYLGLQIPSRSVPFNSLYSGGAASAFTDATTLRFWHRLLNFYAQDQFKATTNLTLTAGLRYDFDVFPSAADVKVQGSLNPTNYHNVQPRVGVAYGFRGGKEALRAGFGTYTAPWNYSDLINNWQNGAFMPLNNPFVGDFQTPGGTIGFSPSSEVGLVGPALAGAAFRNYVSSGAYPNPANLLQFPLGFMQRNFPNPYAEHASLELESTLGRGWVLTTGYEYVHALKLPLNLSVNGTPAGTIADGRQKFVPADTHFGFALLKVPGAYSVYNGGTASVRKSFGDRYSILANYTYSKSIDLATDLQLSSTVQNYLNPNADRSVGDNDIRHRFVISALGQTPESWPSVARNIKISVIDTVQTPRYFTILSGSDVNGDSYPFSDRTGLVGRNSYRGPYFYNTDLRLERVFHLKDRLACEASMEAFNLANHINVLNIDQTYGAADFLGPVPHQYGDRIASPANATFATPNYDAPGRQLQGSIRFSF